MLLKNLKVKKMNLFVKNCDFLNIWIKNLNSNSSYLKNQKKKNYNKTNNSIFLIYKYLYI